MSHLYDQSPLGKGFSLDMFGRLKTGEAFTIFDSQNRYKVSEDFSNSTTNGNVTYNANTSSIKLNVNQASGDKVYYETKKVFPYQPGKSLQVLQTFNFNSAKANLRQRAGYFSTQNGFFLEQDGSNICLVKRSYVTGSVIETKVTQSTWNQDKLDGTGVSGFTLDLSKAQLMFSEYEWLGVGSVRMGFAIDGKFIIAHQFDHANRTSSTYITTATLPVRYEIENTGTTASNSALEQICTTVISNGGYERLTEAWTATRTTGISSVGVASGYAPIVSIRLASDRTDAVILPSDIHVTGDGNGSIYEYALIRNATITGGVWVVHTESNGNIEYNSNATSMSGGTVVQAGIFVSTTQSAGQAASLGEFRFDLQLGRDQTPTSDTITLSIRHLNTGGTVYGSLGWIDLV